MKTSSTTLPLGLRLSVVQTLLIVVVIACFLGFMTNEIVRRFETHAEEELAQQGGLLVNSLVSYHNSLAGDVTRLATTFRSSLPLPYSRILTQTVTAGQYRVPVLKSGSNRLNLNFQLLEKFAATTKTDCTLFVRSGDNFITIASSLNDGTGSRTVGSLLDQGDARQNLLMGKAFTGKTTLSGREYMTAYLPLIDSSGGVIGASSVSLDFTENLNDLKERIRNTRVSPAGYIYVLNAQQGSEAGTLIIHPAKEGRNIVNSKERDGREFIKEILDKKNGTIRYHWLNSELGEKHPTQRLVAYRYFKEWQWVICVGASFDEYLAEARSIRNSVALAALLLVSVMVLTIIFSVRHWITRPLAAFTAQLDRLAHDDFSKGQRLTTRNNDELAFLARSFNSLLDIVQERGAKLLSREAQILHINETLEEQIVERTEELMNSELRFRSFVENANDILFTLSPEGIIVYVTPLWTQVVGHDLNDVIGKSFFSFLHPDDVPGFATFIQMIFTYKLKQGGAEYRLACTDGSYKWYTANGSPALDPITGTDVLFGIGRDITERKMLDATLRASKELYQSMIDAFDGLMYVTSPEYRLEFMNNRLVEKIGRDASGEFCYGALYGLKVPCSWCVMKEVLTSGIPVCREIEKVLENSWDEAHCSPLNHAQGSASLQTIITDITARKQIEIQLLEAKQFSDQVICSAQEGVIVYDRDLLYRAWNPFMERFTGMTSDEVIGKHPAERFPFLRDNGMLERLATMLTDGVSTTLDFPYTVPQRNISGWASDLSAPLRNSDGQIVGIIATVRDISHRKKLEEELNQKNVQFSLSAGLAKIVSWMFDTERNGFIFSDQYYELLATTAEREGGYFVPTETFIRDFTHPEDASLLGQQIAAIFAEGSDVHFIEIDHRLMGRDGATHYVMTRITIERNESGAITSLYGINQDITDRKMIEQKLYQAMEDAKEASRAKSQFLANMSHEIRTPLNAIIGFSGLILNTGWLPTYQEYIRKIHSAGELLLTTVNDILDSSKIEAGKLTFEEITFSPTALIASVAELLQDKAREKELLLNVELSPGIAPHVTGDPHRLTQILLNLLNNAIKFTDDGEITVACALLQEVNGRQQLRFSITDSGIGLSPDQIARLFAPFTQADTSTTRRYGGTGLGLSISKQLVNLMKGDMWVESHPREGSTFHFTAWFPIGNASDASPPFSPLPPVLVNSTPLDLSQYRILLAEDNETNQELALELLRDTGVKLVIVDNGAKAVQLVINGNGIFDLILMDIQMPIMDGYEATRLIRKDGRFNELPIIAMTAHAMLEERQKLLEAGMNAHIAKPVNVKTMLETIGSFLGKTDTPPAGTGDTPVSTAITPEDAVHVDRLDVVSALERLDGNRKMYHWLVRSFIKKKESALTELEEAIRGIDTTVAIRAAHTMKSSAATIGADRLAQQARVLEQALIATRPPQVVWEEYQQLITEMTQVITLLQSEILLPQEPPPLQKGD